MLMDAKEELGNDKPDGDFYARQLRLPSPRTGAIWYVDRIVLAHRLREVIAQLGFTRFEAAMPDIEGELSLDLRRASLAQEVSWLPAVENHGEGVFVSFTPNALDDWSKRKEVVARSLRRKAQGKGFDVPW